MAGPKIRYDIEANATGAAEVGKLADELEQLGDAVDPSLAARARAAAEALRLIGQQTDAVEAFKRSKVATEEAAEALARAQAAAQDYARRIGTMGPPTRDQIVLFDKLRQEVGQAKDELIRQTAGLDAARGALQRFGVPLEGLAERQAQLRKEAAATREELTRLGDTAKGAAGFTQLVRDTDAARSKMEAAAQAADLYNTSIGRSGPPTAKQAENLRALQAAAEKARTDFEALQSSVVEQAGALRQAGANTERLTEQARELTAAQRQAAAAAQAFGQQSAAGARQAATANEAARESIERIGEGLRSVSTAAATVIGGGLLGGTVGELAKAADAFANIQARLKLAAGEGANVRDVFDDVAEVALRTNSKLESTGDLFGRIARAGREIGLSNRDALSLTETINQAIQLSGGSAESADAAITQLIQGLQSGVLRGEEFNSVMEQAPRLAIALADGLGVTTGELRKQAEAGALTSQVVIRALQGQAQVVAGEFSQLPPTVGRALQNLSTQWTRYVGEVDKANGISSKAASIITGLANNLDTLGAALFSAGKAAAAYAALRLAQNFLAGAQAATASAAAKVQETAATAANTSAQAANTAATVANTAAKRAAAGALGSVGAAAEGSVGSVGRLAGLMATLRTFTLIGIVTNLQEIGTWLGESIAKWQGYGKVIQEAEAKQKALEAAQREMAAQDAAIAQQRQKAAEATLGLSTQSKALIGDFEKIIKDGGSVADALAKVSKEASLTDISGIRSMSAALDALRQQGKITGEQVKTALADALKGEDLLRFETQARAAFDTGEQGARRLASALDAIDAEALRRAGTSADELQSGMSRAASSAINDLDALVGAMNRLGVRSAETSAAVAGSLDRAIDAANSERAVNQVIARFEELGRQGLITGEQLAAGMDKARAKLDELKPGVNSLDEALSTFGLKSREELTRVADRYAQSWAQIRNSTQVSLGDQVRAFEQYRDAAAAANGGIVPSALQVEEAILRTRAAAQASSSGLSELGDSGVSNMRRIREEARETFNVLGQIGERAKLSGDNRAERLAGQNAVDAGGFFRLRDKLDAGTLTAADEALVRSVAESARQNALISANANPGALSFDFTRSLEEQTAVAQRAMEALQTLKAAEADKKALEEVRDFQQKQSSRTDTVKGDAPPKEVTVNLNIGGRAVTLRGTESEVDRMMQALEQARKSSS